MAWLIISKAQNGLSGEELAVALQGIWGVVGGTSCAVVELEGGGVGLPALVSRIRANQELAVTELLSLLRGGISQVDWATLALLAPDTQFPDRSQQELETLVRHSGVVLRCVDGEYLYLYLRDDLHLVEFLRFLAPCEVSRPNISDLPNPF